MERILFLDFRFGFWVKKFSFFKLFFVELVLIFFKVRDKVDEMFLK